MYVNTIVLIYPSSHLSFRLTISLFDKSVSVFFCGNFEGMYPVMLDILRYDKI